jgi:hypothetical protein
MKCKECKNGTANWNYAVDKAVLEKYSLEDLRKIKANKELLKNVSDDIKELVKTQCEFSSGLYCRECATKKYQDNISHVYMSKCISKNCNSTASYGNPTDMRMIYCAKCAEELNRINPNSYINCRHEKCVICGNIANFGDSEGIRSTKGKLKKMYCAKCANDINNSANDTNVNTTVVVNNANDNTNMAVNNANDNTTAVVNNANDNTNMAVNNANDNTNKTTDKPKYNSSGRQIIDTIHKKCEYNENNTKCYTHANFGFNSKQPQWCEKHGRQLHGDKVFNIVAKICAEPGCNIQATKKLYGNYCYKCFVKNNPDSLIIRNYRIKEFAVLEYISSWYKGVIISDKTIQGGTSKRRPDILIQLENVNIICEINEYGHENYDKNDYFPRINDIYNDLNKKPLIYINFNPDKYINSENKELKSCWNSDFSGKAVIGSQNNWNKRLEVLKENIEYWITNAATTADINVVNLFQSPFDENLKITPALNYKSE